MQNQKRHSRTQALPIFSAGHPEMDALCLDVSQGRLDEDEGLRWTKTIRHVRVSSHLPGDHSVLFRF